MIEDDPSRCWTRPEWAKLIQMACDWPANPAAISSWGSAASTAVRAGAVGFCDRLGMNYVSCSPFRVPIARLAAAQAALATRGTMDRTRATV